MTIDKDPLRLLDAASSDEGDALLRAALREARADVSPEDAMTRMLARFPLGPGPGGGHGPSGGHGASGGHGTSGGGGSNVGVGQGGAAKAAVVKGGLAKATVTGAATVGPLLSSIGVGALAGVVVSFGLWASGADIGSSGAPQASAVVAAQASANARGPGGGRLAPSDKASPEEGQASSAGDSPSIRGASPAGGAGPSDRHGTSANGGSGVNQGAREAANGAFDSPGNAGGAGGSANGVRPNGASPTSGSGESAGSGPAESAEESEAELLARAQSQVSGNPAGALALTERHRARFPGGLHGQERELIAISALVKLGRTAEARARADAFLAVHPSSAHRRRLAVIVPGLSAEADSP